MAPMVENSNREIQRVLDHLRRLIRRYVAVETIAAVLVTLAIIFWITLAADSIWFALTRLELPRWFRTGTGVLAFAGIAGIAVFYLVTRVLRRLRPQALAMLLERRFPQLRDRLITAVELKMAAHGGTVAPPLARAMADRTIVSAAEAVSHLDLHDVFNTKPLKRLCITAAVLLAAIAGFGVMNAEAMERWYHAFVLNEDGYWDRYRRAALEVRVVAQPGERVHEFSEDRSYKHPRGSDLTILATVPEGKQVPERVVLDFAAFAKTGVVRGDVTMTRIGEREFRHTLSGVLEDHHLWLTGGDFTTSSPYRVLVVPPPRIDSMTVDAKYPDYTRLDALEETQRTVQGTQISLPMETRFTLRAAANKPLTGVQLRLPDYVVRLGTAARVGHAATVSRVTATGEESAPVPIEGAAQFAPEEDGFAVRFHLQTIEEAARSGDDADGKKTTEEAEPGLQLAAGMEELPLPPDRVMQVVLTDTDGIVSTEPIRLTINGIVDQPPVVETRLKGIGTSVTRLATIPISGLARDDYGVAVLEYGTRRGDAEEYDRSVAKRPRSAPRSVPIGATNEEPARFPLQPLALSVGDRLTMTIFARDTDNINGPHESHGEVFSFQVVSNEELLAMLYDKELNLRRRFEQILEEVRGTRTDLQTHRQRSERRWSGTQLSEPQRREIDQAVSAAIDHAVHGVRKNHTETRTVEELFRDIRAELINNGVDTRARLERIDSGILVPLNAANEIDYPQLDANLALLQLAKQREEDPRPQLDTALADFDVLIARLEKILLEMQRRQTFNELVKAAQELLDRQIDIHEKTKEKSVDRFFDDLLQ